MLRRNRKIDQPRPLILEIETNKYAEGSCFVRLGDTHILCTASFEENVPRFLQGTGQGWVTAEYAMLPRSTHTRLHRDKGTSSGRSQEISRLVARSLRQAVNLKNMGETSITLDCDVIQADGGTRTAAITGGYIALAIAIVRASKAGILQKQVLTQPVAAISVGIDDKGTVLVDLDYNEDSQIGADINFVFNDKGSIIEIQGTAEKRLVSLDEIQMVSKTAFNACKLFFQEQQKVLSPFLEKTVFQSASR